MENLVINQDKPEKDKEFGNRPRNGAGANFERKQILERNNKEIIRK